MSRCYNPKDIRYPNYGGRGITVCERWHTLENFLADMGKRPPGLTLDRLDNDGNYELSNCEWRTNRDQANNKRNNKLLTLHGKTQTRAQWSRKLGIAAGTIGQRLASGWSVERALTTPVARSGTAGGERGRTS